MHDNKYASNVGDGVFELARFVLVSYHMGELNTPSFRAPAVRIRSKCFEYFVGWQ